MTPPKRLARIQRQARRTEPDRLPLASTAAAIAHGPTATTRRLYQFIVSEVTRLMAR